MVMERKEPFVCDFDNPWGPEDGTPVRHTGAREVGEQERGWPAGDTVTMECPHCGTRWTKELAQ